MSSKTVSPNSATINRLLILASALAPAYLLANWADVPVWIAVSSTILLLAMLLAIIATTIAQYARYSHAKTNVYCLSRSWGTLLAICLAAAICLLLPAKSTIPKQATNFAGKLLSLDRHNGHLRMKIVDAGKVTAIRVQHHFTEEIAQIEPNSDISGLWDGNYLISVRSKHRVYLSQVDYLKARQKFGKRIAMILCTFGFLYFTFTTKSDRKGQGVPG